MRSRVLCVALAAAYCVLTAKAQLPSSEAVTPTSSSPDATSTSPSSSITPDATVSPVRLTESQVVSTTLDVNATQPARFFLDLPFKNASNHLYISAAICGGPSIPPYDVYNSTMLKQLDLSSYEASMSTLLRIYLSTDQRNKAPGPDQTDYEPDLEYFQGGLVTIDDSDKEPDGAWISIWPPEDTRNTTGTWDILLAASTEGPLVSLQRTQGLLFADSDSDHALLTTFNASQGVSSNLSIAILPTHGSFSLQHATYLNSSICAISQAFNSFNQSGQDTKPLFNRSLTTRGEQYSPPNTTRVQWEISNLQPDTNYTAWLVNSSPLGDSGTLGTTLWPAVKFVTKKSDNCRLVYDVDFCPQVAYSIPIARSVSTAHALDVINQTVSPNYANFSITIDSFPCGSEEFGQYSPIQNCEYCKIAYRDWLCAVTMPRCVDPLPSLDDNSTAAVPDVLDMTGTSRPLNTGLLPYVINRSNNSRQPYVEALDGLNAPPYGELLPCIYTCFFVSRNCPQPLIQWYCPLWDITAQGIYGTFADAGDLGVGGGYNGGAGDDNQRWGGPTRYIAQDAFGNLFCNSLGVDRILLLTNTASRPTAPVGIYFLATLAVTMTFFSTFSRSFLLL